MEMAKVTSKGQITIPVSIRRRLDIKEGDKLLFIDNPDGVVMVNPDMLQSNTNEEARNPDTIAEPVERVPANDSIKTNQDSTPVNALISSADKSSIKPTKDIATPYINNDGNPQPGTQIKGVNISALLDEIRSIGSKI